LVFGLDSLDAGCVLGLFVLVFDGRQFVVCKIEFGFVHFVLEEFVWFVELGVKVQVIALEFLVVGVEALAVFLDGRRQVLLPVLGLA